MSQETKAQLVNRIVNKVIGLINNKIDVEGLQKKYKATKGKIIQGRLTDVDRVMYLQVKDGAIRRLKNPDRVDGFFETTTSTLINLFRGKVKVINPTTGEETYIEYTPIDAIRYGDIVVGGNASTADVLLFARHVHREVYPQVKNTLSSALEEVN